MNNIIYVLFFLSIISTISIPELFVIPSLVIKADAAEIRQEEQIHAGTAWNAYNKRNLNEAERQFRLLIDMEIEKQITLADNSTTESKEILNLTLGLGYTLYQQEKYETAYELINDFIKKYEKHKSIKISSKISQLPEIVKMLELKQMICSKLSDITTSKAKKGRYATSYGYDNTIYHRHKNGDDGTSRVDESGFSASFNIPNVMQYNNILLTDFDLLLKSRYLSNGVNSNNDSADNSYINTTGSFYRNLNGQQPRNASKNNNLIVHEASIKMRTDQIDIPLDFDTLSFDFNIVPFDLEVVMGISPAGGAVEPTPVFSVAIDQKNSWRAEIHRSSVNDSILSIVGLDDPYSRNQPYKNQENDYTNSYSDKSWGRVVKNGISLGKNISFGENNWLSLNGVFDAYRGVNVMQNSGWQINAATGKTIVRQNGDQITFGVYATWIHFEHNSNFYTYGHGGYYSPDFMLTAGPLFRYKTASCRDYWIDAQFSVGLMAEDNADAPKYPIHYEIVDGFTEKALYELQGIYSGDSSVGVAGSMKLEGWKIITEHLSAGSFLSMNGASEDFEWYLGAAIKYSFNARDMFLK
ncbi:MAG: BCSC C-terminal domain-containing protein [Desulfamplus sp.]|nr:BCSC C-terminal domain-containing protein [Desulfamplus sp.]MBF0411868.1 BCSC C-terminal domain-containing protein [Desulfamplus sp.]